MIIFLQRKQKIGVWILVGVLFLTGLFVPVSICAEENLDMYSGSYALIDGDSGRILAGKNETNPMANASTTKILTCIVTLENCDLNDMVQISANAAGQPRVHLGMAEGEVYPLKDLLYGLMLESYNDCAVAIAEHAAGSVEQFAEMMNQKAAAIGCQDTYFITPNGLDQENANGFHHTTAADLCKIMAYCTWQSPQKDVFLQITQTASYSGTSNEKSYDFTNHNAFLTQMEGVLSGKTGFTNKAGYCYVAALERDGERYCIALLACGWPNHKNYKWQDARTLFEYGLANYEVRTVELEAMEESFPVEGYVGKPKFAALHQNMELSAYMEGQTYQILLKKEEMPNAKLDLYTDIRLPVVKGQKLGECKIYLGEMLIDCIELKAFEDAGEWNFRVIIEMIFRKFFTFSG